MCTFDTVPLRLSMILIRRSNDAVLFSLLHDQDTLTYWKSSLDALLKYYKLYIHIQIVIDDKVYSSATTALKEGPLSP